MRAMLLAAGRGERLRPLTDRTPKPLIDIAGKPLIVHHLEKLARAGFRDVVINVSHLRDKIISTLGDGSAYDVHIHYSDEGDHRLETGGGIFKALPLLGPDPFLVINSDIWCDYDLRPASPIRNGQLAHLVMTDNPAEHPEGDFAIREHRLSNTGTPKFTFSGIAWYRPEFFDGCTEGRFPLAPLFRSLADKDLIGAELYAGFWMDLGTLDRVEALCRRL